ncbi:Type 1 glutamine amidotransferase-like domain-containing protein [Senegalia massiliensis]|uniref:Type 1 glutamine amidotransferase-like domain-containing protein n=1 Tax=Senegalia massiliensis TaxID=1720316 RepID=UPI0010313E77
MHNETNTKSTIIPTASGELKQYIEAFSKVYGEKLGCKVGVLKLIDKILKNLKLNIK